MIHSHDLYNLFTKYRELLLVTSLLIACVLFSYITTRNIHKHVNKKCDCDRLLRKRIEINYHALFSTNGDFPHKRNGKKGLKGT